MVFSSPTFLFYFLPVFLLFYFTLPFRNATLLIFSLLFYAWGEGFYVLLMIGSGLANHVFAQQISPRTGASRQVALAIGVATNLLVLIAFKYAALLVEAANTLTEAGLTVPHIHLPIGISFFTFHAISYLVDVYRRTLAPERSALNVLLYLALFPQLVAGPIVRFGTVSKEIHDRGVTAEKFALGVKFFCIGLAQKVLIANAVAAPTDAIFKLPTDALTASMAWLATACYTLQIYFDFAGYSNMAIGLGLMMGFYFPINFDYPYIARSITEFWRRWHISLSTWFRDYLYIPLGGNRHGAVRTCFNLFVVFLLCGLWHGASWTFAVWGLYHGAFLIIERAGLGRALAVVPRVLQHAYTLLVVAVGWVFFRASDFGQAFDVLAAMSGFARGDGIIHSVWQYLLPDVAIALVVGAAAATPIPAYLGRTAYAALQRSSLRLPAQMTAATALYVVFALSVISIVAGNYSPFIYFRF